MNFSNQIRVILRVGGYYLENNATLWPILQAENCKISAKLRLQDRAECGNKPRRATFHSPPKYGNIWKISNLINLEVP